MSDGQYFVIMVVLGLILGGTWLSPMFTGDTNSQLGTQLDAVQTQIAELSSQTSQTEEAK